MTSRIVVALSVPGPPERAFRIFTEEIGMWWRDNPLFRLTPSSPGRIALEPPVGDAPGRFIERLPDGATFLIGDVTVWETNRRLVFGWRQASFAPEQATEVEVRFEAVGDDTRVTVQHTGWDSVPSAHVARHGMPGTLFEERHGLWWRALLSAMAARIAVIAPRR